MTKERFEKKKLTRNQRRSIPNGRHWMETNIMLTADDTNLDLGRQK